jgi:predicted kinase
VTADPGTLILMCGPPCSGKTTVATALALALGAVRLAPDEWIAVLGLDQRTPLRDNVDALQWKLAQQLITTGVDVIIESGHWMRSERDEKRRWARQVEARVELHYLDVPVDVLLERARRRTADDAPATYQLTDDELLSWLDVFEPPSAEEAALFDGPDTG